jgi:4-nitrophenyl phosphatase
MNQEGMPIRNLILDMDGVLWRGETAVTGLVDFFDTIRQLGLGFVLATNNATKTAAQYEQKLAGMGVSVPPEQILTSAEATAAYLSHHYSDGTKVYVVGESGLHQAMANRGFSILPADGFVGAEARAALVVVGFNRQACYEHLASAAYLINLGARFIGTNPDVTVPSEYGLLPGAGSLLAYLETATGVKPEIVGKPNRRIFDQALERLAGTADDTVMVGDRLTTDIAGAQAAGLRTILLLSGVSKMEDIAEQGIRPDWVFPDLNALAEALGNELPVQSTPSAAANGRNR